jgi:putative heme-binding domain-containing protein
LALVVERLAKAEDAERLDMLLGVHEAFVGRREVAAPKAWPEVYRKLEQSANAAVREKSMLLALLFDDQGAAKTLRALIADAKADSGRRATALQALGYKKDPGLVPVLRKLVEDKELRGPALRALAVYSDNATPGLILAHYATFSDEEKASAIATLASRPAYALALLEAVEKGQVPRQDVSAFTVRQMQALKSMAVSERVNKVWGTARVTSADKEKQIIKYKALLNPAYLKGADLGKGRLVFQQECASCHTIFGEGGKVGPDLTGSQRHNLDYVLENVLDPSAIVPPDYQVTLVQLRDGRLITGIIKSDEEMVLTLQTEKELLRVPTGDIDERRVSPISMMPEGLLAKLSNEQARDLVAYLASPAQVALPKIEGKRP